LKQQEPQMPPLLVPLRLIQGKFHLVVGLRRQLFAFFLILSVGLVLIIIISLEEPGGEFIVCLKFSFLFIQFEYD
jgi:hypothetical protein